MNVEFVLKLVKPHLTRNKLKESDFEKIFSILNLHEKYAVIDTLIANDIEIVYEDDELKSNNESENIEEEMQPVHKKVLVNEYRPIPDQINISNEQLCLMYQKGDDHALDLLYIKNQRFIWKMVQKIGHRYNHKLDDEDLVSYGFFGLRKAAKRFDAGMENKFLTYAGNWIIQAISRAIADYGFTIRIPVHMFETVNYIRRVSRDNVFDTEAELIEFISKEKDVDESKVREWFVVAQNIVNPVSLNIPVGEDLDSELIEFLASHEPPIENEFESKALRLDLVDCIECLKPKQSEIIKMRFGFDCEQMTLEEVGHKYNVTRERIRQIEAKALKKLAAMKKMKELHIYLED